MGNWAANQNGKSGLKLTMRRVEIQKLASRLLVPGTEHSLKYPALLSAISYLNSHLSPLQKHGEQQLFLKSDLRCASVFVLNRAVVCMVSHLKALKAEIYEL